MQIKKNSKQFIPIVAVILMGAVLALSIIISDKPQQALDEHGNHTNHLEETAVGSLDDRPKHGEAGHDHEKDHMPIASSENDQLHTEHNHVPQPQEIAKGPHGGKLFSKDGYGLEVTIFEQNTPPEFRIYTYMNGKTLDPYDSIVSIRLERLGITPQQIKFEKEKDYLKGNSVVQEPHSFNVNISAKYKNRSYQFSYEQIEARISISDEQLKINSIEVLTAGPARIRTVLNLQGEVKLNADKSVHIVPRVGGIVESVNVNAGDKVRKGQVLASISSQLIADIRNDLLAAQQRISLARSTYDREKQLWEEKISAEQDYLQAQYDLRTAEINANRIQQKLLALGATSQGQTRYDIRAPIDGVITNKQVSQGQVVSEVNPIFEVADLSTVWVEMSIYAKDINAVKIGQKVTVKASAFEAQSTGTISYVGALVSAESRVAMARVVIKNTDQIWLPGLPVNIDLTSDEVAVRLAVSLEGIQSLRDWTVVFARYGEYFEARPLLLGRRDNQHVEILDGLNVGDKYAAGNSFLIKADVGKAGATHDH